jgi:hypothetical protein
VAIFKHVLQFIDVNGSPFNEIYYHSGTSLASELVGNDAIYQARLALLATPNTLNFDRISNTEVVRQTGRVAIRLPGTRAVPLVGGAADLAPPGAAMVVNLVGAGGGTRYLWMRGGTGNDFSLDASGRPNPTPSWKAALNQYLGALSGNLWGLRTLISGATNKPSKVSVVDGSVTPGQSVLTLSAPIAGLLAGNRVLLGGFDKKIFPALNGQFSVIAIGTTPGGAQTVTVPYVTAQSAKINANQGTARLVGYNAVFPIDPVNSKFAYPGTRITKNPFSNSRGAKRAARIRLLA